MTQSAALSGSPITTPVAQEKQATDSLIYGLSPTAWFKIIAVSVLMIATFRFNLVRLWLKTNPFTGELNWRHSVCVPLIGLYYLYVNREELLKAKTYTAWSGLGILIFGILLFAFAIWPGQNDFLKDFGMVVTLFGVVTLLCGWEVMKIAWFPIVFLVCAIPWPELVYSFVASPLQRLAASVAVGTLRLTGVEALNSGTKIFIAGKNNQMSALNVAEACAGLRSLMTFISVGGAVAFLSLRPLWQKVLITLSAIPIAIFCNVMRVSGQGLLDHYISHQWSEGFAHQFAGVVMLVPGFLFILLVGWFLDQMFVEVADEAPRPKRSIVKVSTNALQWSMPKPVTAPANPATSPVAKTAAAAPVRPVAAKPAAATVPAPAAPKSAASAPARPTSPPPAKPIAKPPQPAAKAAPAIKPAPAPKPVATPKPATPAATPSPAVKKPIVPPQPAAPKPPAPDAANRRDNKP